jgi:hypothetical protein
VALDKGDGRAYANDVREDGDNCVGPRERGGMAGGERHHDPIHERVNEDAVERAVDEWLAHHECEFAAGEIKYGGGGEGHEVMNSQAKRGGGNSTVERFIAEKACGDSAEKSGGLHALQAPGDECGGDVHASAEKAGPEDGGERARFFGKVGDGWRIHVLSVRFAATQLRLSRPHPKISGRGRN